MIPEPGGRLSQFRVLSLGFFQDGNVGIGVFPDREEILVGSQCPDAGSIRIRSRPVDETQSPAADPVEDAVMGDRLTDGLGGRVQWREC